MIGRNAWWLRPLPVLYIVRPGWAGAVSGFESRVGLPRSAPARIAGPRWPRVSLGSRAVAGGSVLCRGGWWREGWRAEAWLKGKAGRKGRARVVQSQRPRPPGGEAVWDGEGSRAPPRVRVGLLRNKKDCPAFARWGPPVQSGPVLPGRGGGYPPTPGRPVPAPRWGLRGSRAPGMPDTQLFPRPSRAGSGLVSSYTPYIVRTGPGRAGARWPPALQPARARRGEPRSRPCPPSWGRSWGRSWGSGGFFQVKGGKRLVLARLSGALAG